MKADKENCWIYTDDNYKTCEMVFKWTYYSDDDHPRVILVPKVYREDGKQYKVEYFQAPVIPHTPKGHITTIKAPKGCKVELFLNCVVEYYD